MKKFFCFVFFYASIFGYCSDDEDISCSNIHADRMQNKRSSGIVGKDTVEHSFRCISNNRLVLDKYIGTASASFLLETKLHQNLEKITEIDFFSSFPCAYDIEVVSKVKGLQTLVFEETDLSNEALKFLQNSSVSDLVFCNCNCSPSIIDGLFSLPSLRSLTLDRIDFGDFYSEELVRNSSLKELVITSVPLGERFIRSINANKSLEVVAIRDGFFTRHLKPLFTRKIKFFE